MEKNRTMKTILLPVDFSANTLANCKHAIYLAGDKQTRLFLFHIYPDQIIVPDSSFPVGIDTDAFFNVELITKLREQAEINIQKLKSEIQDFCQNEGHDKIEIDYLVTGGDAEWEIQEICKESSPDLIVMGTEGEGNKGILEGSIAKKLMNKLTVPILAIPKSFQQTSFKNIMYATEFSDRDAPTLRTIFELFSHLHLIVHLVHFRFDERDSDSELKIEELEQVFEKERLAGKINFNLVPATEKADVLAAFTNKYEIDMIAFLSHKKNFFQHLFSQKISKSDFFKLKLPMLALNEGSV